MVIGCKNEYFLSFVNYLLETSDSYLRFRLTLLLLVLIVFVSLLIQSHPIVCAQFLTLFHLT